MEISARLVLGSAFPKPGSGPGDLWGLQEALPLFQEKGFFPFSICWVGIKRALCQCLSNGAGLLGLSMSKVEVAFPEWCWGTFGVGKWHKVPFVPQIFPCCGHMFGIIGEGPEFPSQGGVPQENRVPSLDPELRDPYLLSWEFSWSIPPPSARDLL